MAHEQRQTDRRASIITIIGGAGRAALRNRPRYRKGIVAVVAGVAEAVSLGLLHGRDLKVALLVLAVATAAGVIGVPNKPKADAP